MTEINQRLELTLSGIVQGVTLRWNTQRFCRQAGLTGFVKNETDGTVTIVAEGDSASLDELVGWLNSQPIKQAEIRIIKQIRRPAYLTLRKFEIIW